MITNELELSQKQESLKRLQEKQADLYDESREVSIELENIWKEIADYNRKVKQLSSAK